MTDILFRLRLRGQAATKAGLDSTSRSVKNLRQEVDKANRPIFEFGNAATVSATGLSKLQAVALSIPPVLVATAGTTVALTAALAPLVGVAAAAGDALLAAGQGAGVFALATSGLGAALKASSDPEKYAEALAALPPSARKFSDALVSMKPLLDDLRETAAAGFFPGAEKGLHLAARNFGVVQQVVAATAKVLGDLATRAGALVGSSAFGADLKKIGLNNAKVIDTLGGALLHVVSALRHVLVEAGPLTQWLADVINKWALHAAVAAKSARETGKMAEFFEKTRKVLTLLGSIVSHVTKGIFGIGKAGTESGNSMWESINRVAIRFDQWANSTSGQESIKRFFKDSKELMAALLPVIGHIVGALALLSMRLLPLTEALRLIGPYADEATVAFVYWKLAVTASVIAVKLATIATTAWSLATALATTLANAHTVGIRAIIQALAMNALAHVRATIAIVAQRVATVAATVATTAMAAAQWLWNAAMAAFPVFAVIAGVTALAAGLIYAFQHSETFRNAVNGLWQALQDGFGWVQDNWPLLATILTTGLYPAIKWIVENFGAIKGAAKDAINAVISILNAGIDVINVPFKLAGKIPGAPDLSIPHVPFLASGGVIPPGGSAIVGDRPAGQGGELITAPGGAVVHDSKSSAAIVGGRQQIVLHNYVMLDGREVSHSVATHWAEDAAFA